MRAVPTLVLDWYVKLVVPCILSDVLVPVVTFAEGTECKSKIWCAPTSKYPLACET